MNVIYRQFCNKRSLILGSIDKRVDLYTGYEVRAAQRALVTQVAFNYYGLMVDRFDDGAPFFVNSDKKLSISHTENYIAICVSDGLCGLDIELNTRDASRAAKKYTNDIELAIAKSVYTKNPHLLIWCIKEAMYKRFRISGAEFLNDFKIEKVGDHCIECIGFGEKVDLFFFEYNDLLVVYC